MLTDRGVSNGSNPCHLHQLEARVEAHVFIASLLPARYPGAAPACPSARADAAQGSLRTRGTSGSNPCTLQSGYWLVGIVDWPNRAGLPGVARESCVLSTWKGPAPRQVGRDGSPVGGCASSASTGIDARCGGRMWECERRSERGGRD